MMHSTYSQALLGGPALHHCFWQCTLERNPAAHHPLEIIMKIKSVITAILAVTMGMGGVSFAHARDHRGHRNDHAQNQQERHHDQGERRNDRNRHHHKRAENPHERQHERHQSHSDYYYQHDARGAGPDHAFYRGGRLSGEYRSRQYVVDDWRGHRLSAPPHGYHWVQTGKCHALIATRWCRSAIPKMHGT
jgi:Ni/Co efflux regulator RcnB